jgi:hypothetical protein
MRRLLTLAVLTAIAALAVSGPASAAGIPGALSLSPDSVRDGASSQGTMTLAFPDTADNTVLLFSSDPSVASVPASVIIPAGSTAGTFTISTNAAAPPTNVTITAWVGNTPRTSNLSVNAATPAGASLTSVSVSPASVTGGSASTGTVQFSGTTDGAVVKLSSSNPALVGVPAETVVNGGQASGAFPVTTSAVGATTTVTITAAWFGVTRTTTITLTPGAPAAADKVVITKARWKAGLLTIEATSTNPKAILSVFSQSGSFMFTLTNNGGGRYSDQRGFVFSPVAITVRSNLGGSATATLTR